MVHIKTLCLIVIATCISMAEDKSESGVPTSPLTIYSGGIGIGAVKAVNNELKLESKAFGQISFFNEVYLNDNFNLFADVNWYPAGVNLEGTMGVDALLLPGPFRPLIGFGVGAAYFDKSDEFGDNFGPSATIHLGFKFDITRSVHMRVRIPYRAVLNETNDQTIGIDFGFLFSTPYQHVKQLNY